MPSLMTSSTPADSLLRAATAIGHDADRLARHRRVLARHENAAESFLAAGEPEDALRAVTTGALMAGIKHPGLHASVRLERVLEQIGREHVPTMPARERSTEVRRVLHIATETYQVGGHSRVIWRWIARDPSRRHDLVLTTQRTEMPKGITAVVRASGGKVTALQATTPALDRAATVRELAQEADVIVLHIHPHDPIPAVALADANRPPVVLFNHGDHLFWLGAAVVDVLHNIRPGSIPVATERRGIGADRCLLLPFPVTGPDGNGRDPSSPVPIDERTAARKALLRELRWPEDTVVLVTIGAAFKYDGPEGHTLLDLVEPVLRDHPRARLVAYGPAENDAWSRAKAATGGRVVAMGPKTGMGPVLAASDIYLESRPFGGTSAAAEAASHGLPVITCAATELEAQLLTTPAQYGATTVGTDEHRETVGRLIEDAQARSEAGDRARAAVAAADAGWEPGVEQVYRSALASEPASAAELDGVVDAPQPVDVLVDFIDEIHTERRPLELIERVAASMELAGRSPILRRNMLPGLNIGHRPVRQIPAAFAAPPAEAEALRAVVADMRDLLAVGFVGSCVMALRPEDADAAVPVLEAALEDGGEFPLDLVLDANPARVRPAGALLLVQPGENPPDGQHLVCAPPWRASLA
jgi:hypothetical protein